MEARFGHDFAGVRIHADASGAASAQAVEARAYAVGNHLVFAEGQYAPGTHAGQKLLAHELTHVVQDANRLGADSGSLEIGARDAREETEADAVAEGRRAPGSIQPCAHRLAVRRQPKEAACTEAFLAKVEPIAKRAVAFLNGAVGALKAVRPGQADDVTRLLEEHFHVSGSAVRSFLPDIATRMELIASTARSWDRLTIQCLPRGSGCESRFPARYVADTGGNRLVFCSDFPDWPTAFQIETFIHEMGHAASEEVLDYAYAHERSYASLKPEYAYRNADSYARFAIDASPGLFTTRERQEQLKGAPQDEVTGCSGKGAVSEGELRVALARAERMNRIAAETFEAPTLLQDRAGRLPDPFGLFRRDRGALSFNERLRQQYRKTYRDAYAVLGKKLRVVCRTRDDDYKHYPIEISGDTLTVHASWKRSVKWFGWEKEILSAVYGQVSKRDPYVGDPRDAFRPGTAATIAYWIEADVTAHERQEVGRLEGERLFRRAQEPPLRHIGKDHPRKTVSKGARGCPVPELQEKLNAATTSYVQVTGVFDDDTEKAVADFQASRDLVKGEGERKGRAGPKTWAALFETAPEEHGLPTGETFEAEGWAEGESAPMVKWKQVLQPTSIDFRGCHVMERNVKAPEFHGCQAGARPLGGLSGGVWEVKEGNTYGPDIVGQDDSTVRRIRMNPSGGVPCLYSIPQAMVLLRQDAEVRKQKSIEKRVELGMAAEHAEYVRNWLIWGVTADLVMAVKGNEESVQRAARKFP
jgi:hypothetical protein